MNFSSQNLFQIRAWVFSAREAKHLGVTTIFTYSHANTPLGQSERAYYLFYFILKKPLFQCSTFFTRNYIRRLILKGEGLRRPHYRGLSFSEQTKPFEANLHRRMAAVNSIFLQSIFFDAKKGSNSVSTTCRNVNCILHCFKTPVMCKYRLRSCKTYPLAFLAETVETGTKNRCLIEATHVLRRKLRKKNLRLFRNESVHEFYRLKALITLEQVSTTEYRKINKNLN